MKRKSQPQKNILYLNLGLHVFDGVGGLHLQGDGLPGEGFDEDLHLALCSATCKVS